MESGTVAVTSSQYEGPLSLLLSLVRKRKLFINDISLSEIADDFLQEVRDQGGLSEDAEFVDISSTLLLLKSRSLLPDFFISDEEEEAISDLQERLQVYEIIAKQKQVVSDMWQSNMLFARCPTPPEPIFVPDTAITLSHMHTMIRHVISALPQQKNPTRVSVAQTMRLETVVERIRSHVKRSFTSEFGAVSENARNKGEVALFFIALLELVKQGILEARQTESGGISLEQAQVSTPRYVG